MDKKSNVPKIVEMVFDSAYLVTVITGIVLLLRAKTPVVFLRGDGDGARAGRRVSSGAGFLRRRRATGRALIKYLSRGKMITSITMTVFYVLLWHAGFAFREKYAAGPIMLIWTAVVYVLAVVRILLVWRPAMTGRRNRQVAQVEYSAQYSVLSDGRHGDRAVCDVRRGGLPAVRFMWLAVLLSFAFYLPVVLWSRK